MARAGLVYLKPVPVVFFRAQGPYASSVGEAWARMFDWLDANGIRNATRVGYGLARDNPREVGHDKCRYDACVEVPSELDSKALEQVMTQRLSGGAYARQRHTGDYEKIREAIATIRDTWVSSSGLVIDSRRPLVTIYLRDPAFTTPENLKADICVPVAVSVGRSAA